MADEPGPYPRVPHLPPGIGATRDDTILSDEAARPFFEEPVVVEEKLDGASVTLWLDRAGAIAVGSRGGSDAIDRAGQLGPLRAWAAERADALRALLADRMILYGEWLWLVHGVRYDRLPDWFIGLDLWRAETGFLSVDERNARVVGAGLAVPPQLAREVLGSARRVQDLLAGSAFSDSLAEGVIVRRRGGGSPRIAKALSGSFVRRSDLAWRTPERNLLAPR